MVDFVSDKIVLFSIHVTEDLVAACDRLYIMKKGQLSYDGSVSKFIEHVNNHVFRCSLLNESDFQDFQRIYKVLVKVYKANGMETGFVSRELPNIKCEVCVPTLEDAYISYILRKRRKIAGFNL